MTRNTLSSNRHIFRRALLSGVLWLMAGGMTATAETLDDLGILPPVERGENATATAVRNALRSDDFPAAATAVESLLRSSPHDARAEYWAGLLNLRTGKFRDAIRCFRRSQAIANDPYTTEGLALAYYSVRQFHLFQVAMMDAAMQMPNDFAPAYYLGRYYVSVDVADFPRAERYLSTAVLLKPANALARYYLAFSQECLGNIEQSVSTYKEALRLAEPNGSTAELIYLGLARTSLVSTKLQDAIAYAERANTLAPRDPEVHKILGKLYRETGQLQPAIDHWQTAASLDPNTTAPYYNLYRLYMRTDQVSKAKAALEQYKALSSLYGTE